MLNTDITTFLEFFPTLRLKLVSFTTQCVTRNKGNRNLTFHRAKVPLMSKFFIQCPRARSTQWCCSEIAINSD